MNLTLKANQWDVIELRLCDIHGPVSEPKQICVTE